MEDLWVTDHLTIPASEFEVAFARSSGPGGQNVNKVNSKVSVHWKVNDNQSLPVATRHRLLALAGAKLNLDGRIQVVSQEYRDQPANLRACQEKLRQLILQAMRPPKPRRPTQPTKASQRRRLQDKKTLSNKKNQRSQRNWEG